MATSSSFLPSLSLSRGDSPVLPLYSSSRYPPRKKTSEYDLDELSPRAEDAFFSTDHPPTRYHDHRNTYSGRLPSPSSSTGSNSKSKMKSTRFLFDGPPPPIAASRIIYTDEEDRGASSMFQDNNGSGTGSSWLPAATGTARKAISSVIWDRRDANSSHISRDAPPSTFDRNSVWRSLQRREKAIVQDVQKFLEIQEANLSGASSQQLATSPYSDGDSDDSNVTPTGTSVASSSRRLVRSIDPIMRATPKGEVIPVRQPRPKKLGIGGARKGIVKSMEQLANLKDEEDASLLSALSTRKRALAKLRSLATRREGIADELNSLETDDEEPLAKELDELQEERMGVSTEIGELEQRLVGLKTRRRFLDGRIEDIRNRREAGLSGYKNALREVEENVKGFLARPPVKPLDVEALRPSAGEDTQDRDDTEGTESSPGGVEFLRLRPERRTVSMAREWWEEEVRILEKRKVQVDTDRRALKEGAEVWEEVVKIVLGFEVDLRKQMQRSMDNSTKGKGRLPSLEETLKEQDTKIKSAIRRLLLHLITAENKGWTLLIVAISAELEAFRKADEINEEMMRANGIEVDRQVSREDSGTSHNSFHTVNGGSKCGSTILDRHDEKDAESDNEVPPDLLATHEEHHEDTYDDRHENGDSQPVAESDKANSENEVPLEFLAEHGSDDTK